MIRWLFSVGVICFVLQSIGVSTVGDSKKFDLACNSELKKLKFFGAGPKTALPHTEVIFGGKICCMFHCLVQYIQLCDFGQFSSVYGVILSL